MANEKEALQRLQAIPLFQQKEIIDFRSSKLGMTNDSYLFCCEGIRYILRIPGVGTDKLLNRHHEKEVYDCLLPAGFAQDVLYFEENTGIKISRFIENSHDCNTDDEKEVKACFEALHQLHQKKLKVSHSFSLWEEIEKYESYRQGKDSVHEDYSSLKEDMYQLFLFTEKEKKENCLCHIDAGCDNFLLQEEKVFLIDWEYAAMQDPDLDAVMFLVYSDYSEEDIEKYLRYFMQEDNERRRYKMYAYIALTGFLWSSWCEYKMLEGVHFGEYMQRQYRYAQIYSQKVKAFLWPK